MECTVSWTGASGSRSAMGFVAETGSGHVVAMDGAPDPAKPDQSGQNLAARVPLAPVQLTVHSIAFPYSLCDCEPKMKPNRLASRS